MGPAQRLREVVEEAALADQVGPRSSAWASTTAPTTRSPPGHGAGRRGRAHHATSGSTSAVSVLSSDDPVRVFQQFATLDLLSGGRAEIMAGRGSFTESFPLFGYDLADYDALFAEKLDLLLAVARPGAGDVVGRRTAPRSSTSRCTHGRLQDPLPVVGCRGWQPAVGRSGRGCSVFRSRWRSSGANPSGSRRWRTSTAARWPRPGTTSSR